MENAEDIDVSFDLMLLHMHASEFYMFALLLEGNWEKMSCFGLCML